MSFINKLAVMSVVITLIAGNGHLFPIKGEAPMTVERYALICDMSVEEFTLLSSCVEAESNRSTNGDLSGRVLIAETILNRVNDDRFPDTITGVLTQSGQFSTIRQNGTCVTNRTEYSDEAVYIAIQEIEEGTAPNVFFFNCIGYNGLGEPYDCVGGNYFSTW